MCMKIKALSFQTKMAAWEGSAEMERLEKLGALPPMGGVKNRSVSPIVIPADAGIQNGPAAYAPVTMRLLLRPERWRGALAGSG